MNYSDKIKALQEKAGIKADGVVSSKTWLYMYYLLFNSVPYDLNTNSIIRAIQYKLKLRTDIYNFDQTWDILYNLLVKPNTDESYSFTELDDNSKAMLNKMPKEVVLFAKELIRLASNNGICVRLMEKPKNRNVKSKHILEQKFGLSFYVGIFEKDKEGKFNYTETSASYAKLAKLGQSIGLTYNHKSKYFDSLQKFVVVPAWAVRLSENEMIHELSRRKTENINLLAIL